MMGKMVLLPILVFPALGSGAFPVEVDGTVSDSEYDDQVSFADGDLMLYWSLDREMAYCGIRALAEGWVAVGFDPVRAMDQADIIFGWVAKDGTVGALDTFSTGLLGPAPRRPDGGG